jgi:SprT-like family protein
MTAFLVDQYEPILELTSFQPRVLVMAKKTKRKIAYRRLPMQQQLNLRQEGEHFDLGVIFKQLNKRYFRGRLRNYTVEWGRRRRSRPKDHFVFGTIQEEDRVIRIHRLLDQAFVPRWYLKYVLFHEMLHSVVPDRVLRSGRRQVHTEEFNRREREFHSYYRARRWEEQNLARFLR